MNLSVVVPVYNSEPFLRGLVDRLEPVLTAAAERCELILVDDGSPDGSWGLIGELAARHGWVRGIRLMRNYGQHNALLCGVRAARYEVVVTMDDDLQHPPEQIPRLLAKLAEGYDVVYGTPRTRQDGLWRGLITRLTRLAIARGTGVSEVQRISSFRAFRCDLRRACESYRGPDVLLDVLLSWGSSRFASVEVDHEPRRAGRSGYTLRKLIHVTLVILTGFSTAPLRLASLVGLVFTLFGLGVLVFVVARAMIEGVGVPGFPFLASVIAIFSGAQLFSLGIFGEYLARVHARMMDRPAYTVAQETDPPCGGDPTPPPTRESP